MDEFVFESDGLKDLADDLRFAAVKIRDEIDVTLLKVGEELVEAAKALAEPHSKKVADTIKLRAMPGYVVISAGNDETPIAALWELGNKGTHNSARVQGVYFRHPIFGTDNWTTQRRFPFLRPALDADRKNITMLMESAWDRALEPYRLSPEE